jgi:hypothetical protein
VRCVICERSHGFHQLYTISGFALNQIFPSMIQEELQYMVEELPFHVCTECLGQVHFQVCL